MHEEGRSAKRGLTRSRGGRQAGGRDRADPAPPRRPQAAPRSRRPGPAPPRPLAAHTRRATPTRQAHTHTRHTRTLTHTTRPGPPANRCTCPPTPPAEACGGAASWAGGAGSRAVAPAGLTAAWCTRARRLLTFPMPREETTPAGSCGVHESGLPEAGAASSGTVETGAYAAGFRDPPRKGCAGAQEGRGRLPGPRLLGRCGLIAGTQASSLDLGAVTTALHGTQLVEDTRVRSPRDICAHSCPVYDGRSQIECAGT